MSATDILSRIVASKHEELSAAVAHTPAAELRAAIADLPPTRDFAGALRRPGEVRLVAEVKHASPSAGVIRADFDHLATARAYQRAGAACLSVLTDAQWFQGSPQYLRDIRAAVDLPLLRKDFVIDRYQLLEARAWGADCALLIVAILSEAQLVDLAAEAEALGLATLVEVHTADEMAVALATRPRLIGINNRDLTVFRTDLATTHQLRPLVGNECVVVSESGIRTPADVARLKADRVDAMLVGEAIMREADIERKARELVDAGRAGES